jgi:hypothetical protein
VKRTALLVGFVVVAAASYAFGASTDKPLVATYDKIADGILAANHAETAIVRAILSSQRNAGEAAAAAGKWDEAAANAALWANEGDNAVGGIRKRLLEGGHHHNAEGEAKGVFEPGYVIVTVEAKKKALDLVAKIQAAKDDAARKAAWGEFVKLAEATEAAAPK